MKVFKFGGASVKDAQSVRNVAHILREYQQHQLVVIVSAMGKTTNAMEALLNAYYYKKDDSAKLLEEIRTYHYDIARELFPESNHPVYRELGKIFKEIENRLSNDSPDFYDFEYDQLVPYGELLSSRIIAQYLIQDNIKCHWLDARELIKTDSNYRDANVHWDVSKTYIQFAAQASFREKAIVLSQGFIAGDQRGVATTLGREGSDYSAAIFAWALDAKDVTIWKDVPGLLNADPKYFDDTEMIEQLSYNETIELAYYGATIIHPKTIKPLQNKQIPLWVRSFIDPKSPGSHIHHYQGHDSDLPFYIFKKDQVLLSISPRDFSFVAEDNLSEIFADFATHGIKINLMQNSAISFSVGVDNGSKKVAQLIERLKIKYKVKYNSGLDLITIRHYNDDIIEKVVKGRKILLEQRSRTTVQLMVQNPNEE